MSTTTVCEWNRKTPPAHFGEFKWCPLCRSELALYQVCDRPRLGCTNDDCNFVQWDGPLVVALAVVEIAGRIVMVRRAVNPCIGSWCLPGGFVEAKETGEEAAIREFSEETGVDIVIEGLLGAYTPCPDANEIILVYKGKAIGGTFEAGDDADLVGTFGRYDLPAYIGFDQHRRIISNWFASHDINVTSLACQ